MLKREKGIWVPLVVVSVMVLGGISLTPDIKYKTVSKVELAGAAGRAMNFVARLGGGSTDVVETVYLKGNKMLSGNDEHGTLMDLDGERMVMLNHKEKTYSAISFEDFRRRMQEMAGQAQEAAEADAEPAENSGQGGEEDEKVEVKFDFKVDRTGETSTVNGHRAERLLMTILMEAESTEEQKPDEPKQEGTLVIASELWMSEDVSGYDELEAFQKRFAERFGEAAIGEAEMQNLTGALQQAFASDPRVREGMEKAQAEAAKMNGIQVKNVTHVVLVGPGETFNSDLVFKAKPKEEKKKKRGGIGGLAKRLAEQAAGAQTAEAENADEPPTQQTMLTMTSEMQEFSTSPVPASVFEIPSDYREVAFGM